MSLQIFVAHSGQRLDADTAVLSSLDSLRSWIAKNTAIPSQDQILLTVKGKHVKVQALLTEKEIFVYDRELFSLSSQQSASSLVPTASIPEPFVPEEAPSTLSSQTDLKAWQALFKARRDWANGLRDSNRSMFATAQKYIAEKEVIEKALRIATGNHETHIPKTEKKFREARSWFEEVAKEQETNLQNLERDLQQLSSIPARRDFLRFVSVGSKPRDDDRNLPEGNLTLRDFLASQDIKQAASTSKKVANKFGNRIAEMASALEKITSEYNGLVNGLSQSQSRSSVEDEEHMTGSRMMGEIEAVTKKVSSDYEHILSQKSTVPQISKLALLHTRNYLPMIKEVTCEISALLRRAAEQKNIAVRKAIENMRSIASIESMITSVNSDLENLEIPPEGLEAFEIVALVSRLPYVYGSLLIEALRRNEWSEKMKRDSSTLAEEMAGYQEEEEKRRKRWMKSIGDMINVDALQSKVLSFEISIKAEEGKWPNVNRQEVQEYIRMLRGFKDMNATIESLNTAFKDVDRPTKQQIKRVKNFKNGSVHEASFGKGSGLILRGEEELRVLREANLKLEEELKGSKSRIRKLEDLVHRQSHVSRLSIGSGFQAQSIQSPDPPFTPDPALAASPKQNEGLSRRSSVSSRRFSANQPQDYLALTRRILELEGEISSERELRTSLEQDVAAQKIANGDLQRQIEEANSTKKDLMENMEAQQKEFSNERRSLEEEITRHKIRIEECEDEVDRLLGSRDHERSGNDSRMRSLVEELDVARKEASEEVQRAHAEIRDLKTFIDEKDQAEEERRSTLSAAFSYLADGEEPVPEDTLRLVAKLEELAQRTTEHVKDLQQAVSMAKSENETLRSKLASREIELTAQVEAQETEIRRLGEELETAQSKASLLSSELADERNHLNDLRAKFADGETGAEALRQRVTEEEAKVLKLTSQLAEAKSHINGLDVELLAIQKKHERAQVDAETDASRLKNRSLRAKDLTQRIYTQKERLVRLLETLGYAVTFPEGQMVVTRISKTGNSTILPGSAAERSTTLSPSKGSTVPAPASESPLDLSFLQWTEAVDPEEEEAKYEAFLSALSRLNLDTFNEAVLKRVKDYEHTARKWQKEARLYRDRSHKYQSEAHEKIAFRSFKEGDLALFLPTRNQATRPWAAFNVGAPHYFLREQEGFRLRGREWLVARITKIEERIVDLSRGMGKGTADERSIGETSEGGASFEDDNPFDLSDGLRWYLLDATEERPGAPSTPGLGKSTVASTHVDARGSLRVASASKLLKDTKGKDEAKESQAARTLNKSLESRRSSQGSKKSFVASINPLRGSGSNESSHEALGTEGEGGVRRPSHLRSSSQASIPIAGNSNGNTNNRSNGSSHEASPTPSGVMKPPPPPQGNDEAAAADHYYYDLRRQSNASYPSPVRSPAPALSPSISVPDPMDLAGSTMANPAASPTSLANRSTSPSKNRRERGIWDSIFQFDVRVERGGQGRS